MRRSNYSKLSFYIGREYVLSFLIAFAFFFFIFFVNQILVIAQKIVIKNVQISQVISLVVLSIPQFLMYTMPFSSLASASMVIGNFASQNEILAMRSNGIHTRRIFLPIVLISIILSIGTFFIADKLIPYTSEKYRDLYSEVLETLPTIQLDSYSSTQFGSRVITTGVVEGNTINDIVIFDNDNIKESKIVSSPKAVLTLLDLNSLLYRIDLLKPDILVNDVSSGNTYSYASAQDMSLYVSLNSASNNSVTSISPSQMSIGQLMEAIEIKREEQKQIDEDREFLLNDYSQTLFPLLVDIDSNNYDINSLSTVLSYSKDLNSVINDKNFSFYYQYYRSELYKKIALSLACTCLVFVAFPISFFKVRYGRLVGFGLSMIVACIYWFFIYFMHTRAITTSVNPFLYLHLPNITVLFIGLILLRILRKQ